MSHINSHREPRRSKIRDHRRAPSRWRATHRLPLFNNNFQKKAYVRARRQAERQASAHLKDFRCAGGLECNCIGCEATVSVSQRQLKIRIPMTDWDEFGSRGRGAPPSRRLNDWEITEVKETLGRLDLSGADLRGERIRGPAFRGADFRGANLRGADLCGADLRGKDLRGANLRGANLREVDLTGADLHPRWIQVMNYGPADLARADLTGADLRGADLTGAEANEHTKGSHVLSTYLVAAGVVFED